MHAFHIMLSVCVSVYVYTSDLKYIVLKLFQNMKYIVLFYTLKTCMQMVLDYIYISFCNLLSPINIFIIHIDILKSIFSVISRNIYMET